MFLDYAVEPFYYELGMNFYENGQNYAMGSLLYMAGPALLGKDAFAELLAAFQRAIKEKSAEALESLVAAARATTNWRQLPASVDFDKHRRFYEGSQAAELIDYAATHFHGRPGD